MANTAASRMSKPDRYVGLDHEINGGMTTIGKVIRDAQVFELITEYETCQNWNLQGIEALMHKVNDEWDKYGCMVSQLPQPLFERHQRIHNAALEHARHAGWTGEQETEGERI